MLSYVFMKILESRPARYDRGIDLLTLGQIRRVKDNIVKNYVRPGINMLDAGCGTGDLALRAARAGARVTGIDISEGMLGVARRRIRRSGLEERVILHHAALVEMDDLFEDHSFDLVTATLVMSELYPEERRWVLRQFRRVLSPEGTLLIACETRPGPLLKRLLYQALRLLLALVTYLVSHTTTAPVKGIGDELRDAGFKVVKEERSFLESFLLVVAKGSGSLSPSRISPGR
ncbi:MAG: methyltransferase domain-containing protein, partial [Deltaproteobacteria bacterium]|nr:methyltransferase domain-containing protein [Deltaproteobacteria bacterium]